MSAPLFDRVCNALELHTGMSRLEARGTLRIALKEAGLEPRQVSGVQMMVVVTRVLPGELLARGVEDAHTVCDALEKVVESEDRGAVMDAGDRIDGLFRRTL
jgi:hypothetical protein